MHVTAKKTNTEGFLVLGGGWGGWGWGFESDCWWVCGVRPTVPEKGKKLPMTLSVVARLCASYSNITCDAVHGEV